MTPAARGVYLDLLLVCWEQGCLPTADEVLQPLARCTEKVWKQVRDAVRAKFQERNGFLHHDVVDAEKQKANEIYERKSAAGKAGGQASGKQRAKQSRSRNEADVQAEPQAKTNTTYLEQSPNGDIPASQGADAPLKERIFGPCLEWLAKQTKKTPAHLRALVGKWCSQHGDGKTLEAMDAAAKNAPLDPIPYITRILAGNTRAGKPSGTDWDGALAAVRGSGEVDRGGDAPGFGGTIIDGEFSVDEGFSPGKRAPIPAGGSGLGAMDEGLRDPDRSARGGAGDVPENSEPSAGRSSGSRGRADHHHVQMAEAAAPSGHSGDGCERAGAASAATGASGACAQADGADDLEIPGFLDRRPSALRCAS